MSTWVTGQLDQIQDLCASQDENALQDARSVLNDLKVALCSDVLRPYKTRYKIALQKVEQELVEAERRQLLPGNSSAAAAPATEDLSLQRLVHAHQQLLNAEQVAAQTLTSLQEQKEKLIQAQDNVAIINDELSLAHRLLRRMSRWTRQ